MRKAYLNILKTIIFLSYPFLVFWALNQGYSPRILALILILSALFQFKTQEDKLLRNFIGVGALILFSGLWIYDNQIFLKLYPVLVSFSLLAVFSFSLKYPPTIIEKFAGLSGKPLSEQALTYCKKVTWVWVWFFLANAMVSLITVFLPTKIWVFYNGFFSYIIMGIIFAAEFFMRRKIKNQEEKKL